MVLFWYDGHLPKKSKMGCGLFRGEVISRKREKAATSD